MGQGQETRDPQYGLRFDVLNKHGATQLGLMINESWTGMIISKGHAELATILPWIAADEMRPSCLRFARVIST